MKRLMVLMLGLFLVFGLFACGSSSDSVATETTTITGSVSGTTVIAVDDNGDIIALDNTAGRTCDLDSNNDGTNDAFSFNLTKVPINTTVRVYLVTGDGVFPMYFDDNGSTANVISLSSDTNLDLGYVEVSTDTETKFATPGNNPLKNSNVNSGGLDDEEIILSGATIDDYDGTWEGTISVTEGNPGDPDYGPKDMRIEMELSVSGGSLGGTFDDIDHGVTFTLTEAKEKQGYFTFDLPNAQADNSDCDDWNMSFTAILDESLSEMDLNGSGVVCGDGVGQAGTFKGTVFKDYIIIVNVL